MYTLPQRKLGIYYLDYSERIFPKAGRKCVIGYTRKDFRKKIKEEKIPEDYTCWLQECRTPGYLIVGNIRVVEAWINKHLPDKFGEPLNE